jgi:uncharacterized protein YcgI (DUF1989 family)
MIKENVIISNGEGKMFTVKKGQTLRVIAVEGPQAASLIIFNEHDMKEQFCACLTRQNSQCWTKTDKLYSKPAMTEDVMFTVLTDKDGMFWLGPDRCNRFYYEQQHGVKDHNNCHDILAELIKPYGLTSYDVPEVLNVFMNGSFEEDSTYKFIASPISKGDYIDLRAEKDCLVGVAVCPDEFGEYNKGSLKSLGIQILD